MKRKLLFMLILLFTSALIFGYDETEDTPATKTSFSIQTSLRMHTLGVQLLNDYFAETTEIPVLGNSAVGSSLSARASSGNFLLELESTGFATAHVASSTTTTGITSKIYGNYNYINIGYNIYSAFGFRFYPLIGYGSGKTNLSMMKNEDAASEYTTTTFDAIALSPHSSNAVFSKDNSVLNFAIEIDYSNQIIPFFSANSRIGYLMPLSKSIWTVNEIPVDGGPDFELEGLYFQLGLSLLL